MPDEIARAAAGTMRAFTDLMRAFNCEDEARGAAISSLRERPELGLSQHTEEQLREIVSCAQAAYVTAFTGRLRGEFADL